MEYTYTNGEWRLTIERRPNPLGGPAYHAARLYEGSRRLGEGVFPSKGAAIDWAGRVHGIAFNEG